MILLSDKREKKKLCYFYFITILSIVKLFTVR